MLDLWNMSFFNGLKGNESYLTEIPVRVQKEGGAAFVGGGDMDYKRLSVTSSFSISNAEGMSAADFFSTPFKLGAEMAGQQAKVLFDAMSKPSPHGMPFQWKPGELKFEQLLEIWEKMEVDFDSDGKPKWPMMFIPPEANEELKECLRKGHENAASHKKWQELVDHKRKEFDEREARRRLVD